jgi:hypothetical protein
LKIGGSVFNDVAKQFFPTPHCVAVGMAHQQIAALGQRRGEAGLVDAVPFLRGNQHACIAWVDWESEHATAQCRD